MLYKKAVLFFLCPSTCFPATSASQDKVFKTFLQNSTKTLFCIIWDATVLVAPTHLPNLFSQTLKSSPCAAIKRWRARGVSSQAAGNASRVTRAQARKRGTRYRATERRESSWIKSFFMFQSGSGLASQKWLHKILAPPKATWAGCSLDGWTSFRQSWKIWTRIPRRVRSGVPCWSCHQEPVGCSWCNRGQSSKTVVHERAEDNTFTL